MTITRERFIEAAGCEPEQDDLERANCKLAGELGHECCGWDEELNMPVFIARAVRLMGERLKDRPSRESRPSPRG